MKIIAFITERKAILASMRKERRPGVPIRLALPGPSLSPGRGRRGVEGVVEEAAGGDGDSQPQRRRCTREAMPGSSSVPPRPCSVGLSLKLARSQVLDARAEDRMPTKTNSQLCGRRTLFGRVKTTTHQNENSYPSTDRRLP
jgi:hypothetical protein